MADNNRLGIFENCKEKFKTNKVLKHTASIQNDSSRYFVYNGDDGSINKQYISGFDESSCDPENIETYKPVEKLYISSYQVYSTSGNTSIVRFKLLDENKSFTYIDPGYINFYLNSVAASFTSLTYEENTGFYYGTFDNTNGGLITAPSSVTVKLNVLIPAIPVDISANVYYKLATSVAPVNLAPTASPTFNAYSLFTTTPYYTEQFDSNFVADFNVTDPEGQTLTYTIQTAPLEGTFNITGTNTWEYIAGSNAGVFTTVVRASDPQGAYIDLTLEFTVTVGDFNIYGIRLIPSFNIFSDMTLTIEKKELALISIHATNDMHIFLDNTAGVGTNNYFGFSRVIQTPGEDGNPPCCDRPVMVYGLNLSDYRELFETNDYSQNFYIEDYNQITYNNISTGQNYFNLIVSKSDDPTQTPYFDGNTVTVNTYEIPLLTLQNSLENITESNNIGTPDYWIYSSKFDDAAAALPYTIQSGNIQIDEVQTSTFPISNVIWKYSETGVPTITDLNFNAAVLNNYVINTTGTFMTIRGFIEDFEDLGNPPGTYMPLPYILELQA